MKFVDDMLPMPRNIARAAHHAAEMQKDAKPEMAQSHVGFPDLIAAANGRPILISPLRVHWIIGPVIRSVHERELKLTHGTIRLEFGEDGTAVSLAPLKLLDAPPAPG